MTNKIGICTIAFKRKKIADVLQIAAQGGADGIEIWAQPGHVGYPIMDDEISTIRETAAGAGLEICALGSYLQPGKPQVFDGIPVSIENQIQIALLLKTKIIRIWAGSSNFEATNPGEREKAFDNIRRMADIAGEAGITLVLERHNNSLTNTWDSPPLVLEGIGRENVLLNYQVVYPAPADELRTRAVEDYHHLLGMSGHAHLQNYTTDRSQKLERSFLAEGIVDYSRLGAAAKSANYSGYFMIEFLPDDCRGLSTVESLRRDIEYLRGLPEGSEEGNHDR